MGLRLDLSQHLDELKAACGPLFYDRHCGLEVGAQTPDFWNLDWYGDWGQVTELGFMGPV